MWEITGKGLKKPSYLFGTMHVSSKMVFHLSDSFYHAIKSCDAVSLELNPETWQPEMFRMEQAQRDVQSYLVQSNNDYLNEKSFQFEDYIDNLKRALSEEPTQVNGLLYRTYQSQADFEENTYLDLYIYQTGRKLGKQAAGVEDYFETEKLVIEAYQDMAKEKNKKKIDIDGESYYDIEKKIQDAYRRGDLDLMDSLQKLTNTSDAFTEKFLYKRNEIQANSIDSILKKRTLFVGVGAAHLPGDRGVIELLRKMGYKLRPIKMADRDATQKEAIDKMRVPVTMKPVTTPDGFVQLQVPGKLYERSESRKNDSWQYADMENGTYYMLTRVKTHAGMLGQNEDMVMHKIDSLLYEHIPGKIQKKTIITRNGYKGYDITNKTRRGDVQRYNIVVTPYEVLVFKMSGNDDYVSGKEADDFFGSIQLKEQGNGWVNYSPANGGFSIPFPQQPNVLLDKSFKDDMYTWQYEAVDKATGDSYSLWKKSVNNYNFLEEDTFDLSLIEESLLRSEIVEKQVSRKLSKAGAYPALEMLFNLKNGGVLKAKAVIQGSNYYLATVRGKKAAAAFDKFLDGFAVKAFTYATPAVFVDTSLKFSVQTPVHPTFDTAIRAIVEKAINTELLRKEETYNSWPKERAARFTNDTTGESIVVHVQNFAKYYYSKDTAKFWDNQLGLNRLAEDFIVKEKQAVKKNDSVFGYRYVLQDTNSTRKIISLSLLKDNKLFTLETLTDTITGESPFVSGFFNSFMPLNEKFGPSVFENKLDTFFADFYSKDTTTKKIANSALGYVYYGKEGLGKIKQALAKLTIADKDYFELKSGFIQELGFIDDSTVVDDVVGYLKQLYETTADTSSFQNPVILSLARLKTKQSYALLKELLLQDPPVFDDYGYDDIFEAMDSLALTKSLFPEILQLSSLDDYKQPINNLLSTMVDSGYIKAADYNAYYSKLYFDAKIELKKQQNRDEKLIEKEINKADEEEENSGNYYNRYGDDYSGSGLISTYAVLLMPFYDTHPPVQKFFDKLLLSKDKSVRLDVAMLLLKDKKKVPDSVLENLAATDEYRSSLLYNLEDIKRTDVFPAKYKKQVDVARSLLLADKNEEKFFAVELVDKRLVTLKDRKGYVYFFKYKLKKDDDWKMGISGLQPADLKEVNSDKELVTMTDKKIKNDEPAIQQFEKKLKEMVFATRRSATQYFIDNSLNRMIDFGSFGD